MAKILIVIGKLDIGGTEMDLLRNLPKINNRMHQIEVCTLLEPGYLAPQMVASGIPVHCIKLREYYSHEGLGKSDDDSELHAVHSEQKRLQLPSKGENQEQFEIEDDHEEIELDEKLLEQHSYQQIQKQKNSGSLLIKILKKAIVLFCHPFWRIYAGIKWNTISTIRFFSQLIIPKFMVILLNSLQFGFRPLKPLSLLNSFLFRGRRLSPLSLSFSRRFIRIYMSNFETEFPNIQLINRLSSFIESNNYDIVHCFLPDAYYYGTLAAVKANCRHIVASRVSLNHYQTLDNFYYKWERGVLHRLVDIGIGNSKAVCHELFLEGMHKRKVRLHYNGIEYQNFARDENKRLEKRKELGISDRTFVMTAVANLHPYKGHADLIEAVRQQQAVLGEDWVLLIIGHDVNGHQAVLEEMILKSKLVDQIRLLGSRDDVASLLSASDLHIMPSHQEGLPNSVLEAMSASLSVVATNVGGIPELITDGFNGRLVPPTDPNALGRAITDLYNNPIQRLKMGQRSLIKIEESFGLERSVNEYASIYTELSSATSTTRVELSPSNVAVSSS